MRPSDVDVELSESAALNASTSPLRETVSKPELKLNEGQYPGRNRR